nr:hypothetical protein [Bacillus pumilus]
MIEFIISLFKEHDKYYSCRPACGSTMHTHPSIPIEHHPQSDDANKHQ